MISDAGAVDYSLDFISNRFHISTLDSVKDCDYAPMATGGVTNGVTVLEMTAAYATFGNGGYYYEPYCYTKIEDVQGNVVLQKQPEKTKESALSENTAWVMNKLLANGYDRRHRYFLQVVRYSVLRQDRYHYGR